jgi:hypothetical protein
MLILPASLRNRLPSETRAAVASCPATSDPPVGSVTARPEIFFPDARSGRYLFFCSSVPVRQDRIDSQVVGHQGHREPRRVTTEFFQDDRAFRHSEPRPSVLLGNEDPREPQLPHLRENVHREAGFRVEPRRDRLDLFLDELANRLTQHLLLLGELQLRHRSLLRGVLELRSFTLFIPPSRTPGRPPA